MRIGVFDFSINPWFTASPVTTSLIIPAKKEVESLPVFLKEIESYKCKKLVVLQKEDLETKVAIRNIKNIKIIEQMNNGFGNALIEGINSVRTKYCCIINADGAMNPKYLDKRRWHGSLTEGI